MTAKLFDLLDRVTLAFPRDYYNFVVCDAYNSFGTLSHGRYFVLQDASLTSGFISNMLYYKSFPPHYVLSDYKGVLCYWFKL